MGQDISISHLKKFVAHVKFAGTNFTFENTFKRRKTFTQLKLQRAPEEDLLIRVVSVFPDYV